METVYGIVPGREQFGIHSYFELFCFGNYEDIEIAKNLVDILNGNCPGDFRIIHTDGFFSETQRSRGSCLGLPICSAPLKTRQSGPRFLVQL